MTMEFKPADIAQYKTAQRLFSHIASGSKDVFSIGLARYCTYLQLSPDAIIEDRRKTVREGLINNDIEIQRKHEELYAGFAAYLQGIKKADGTDLSPNTIISNMTAAAAFYSRNYYQLQKPDRPAAYNVRALHTPTLDELGRMLELVKDDPVKMGVIAAASSSGMGAGDLLKVKWVDVSETYGSIKDQLVNGITLDGKSYQLIHIHRVRGKTKVTFDTFFNQLTTGILRRGDYPKDKDYVFPLSVRGFEKIVERTSKAANMPGQTTPHMFRRFFTTILKMANFNSDMVELWTAHALSGVRGAYFKPPVTSQLKMYLEAEKHLTPPQFYSRVFGETH